MGWTGLHRRGGLTNQKFFQQEFGSDYEILEKPSSLTEFYTAVRSPQGYVFGLVVLMRFGRGDDYYNFYYKDMDESMGPVGYHAPRKVLELLDDYEGLNEYAKAWREESWKYVKARENRPKVREGDMVVFETPLNFTDGSTEDHFFFVKGSKFSRTNARLWKRPNGTFYRDAEFHITKWRDRKYMVVPALPCRECGRHAILSGIDTCPDCSAKWVKAHAGQ